MIAKRFLTIDSQTELDQAFKLFDADGSGYLSVSELRTLMTSSGEVRPYCSPPTPPVCFPRRR